MSPKKLFLLDGMALAYRAYFALIRHPRMTSKGLNTSAIFGFANTVVSIIKTQNPTHMAVAFDTDEPTQRHREFPDYKAQREKIPEDLSLSLPHIRRIIDAFGIPVIVAPGFEADDIIGTLAKQAEKLDITTFMVTPDKDFSQLVSEKTLLFKPGRSGDDVEIMGIPEVLEKWGISETKQVIDVLGLWGDTSDNIPGIPGIGEKTAKTLIARFGSVESLVENVNELKGKQKENVIAYAEQGLLSKRLVTIDCDAPVKIDLNSFVLKDFDFERLGPLFAEFEFKTLGKRLFGESGAASSSTSETQPDLFAESTVEKDKPDVTSYTDQTDGQGHQLKTVENVDHDYRLVDSPEERKKLIARLNQQSAFCFDTETTGLDPKTAELVGIAFSFRPHTGYYVTFPDDRAATTRILREFKRVFANAKIEKIGHNLKYDISVLHWHGVRVEGTLFDTMVAHYLIEPEGRHKMDILANIYLGYAPIPITNLIGEKGPDQKSMEEVEIEKVVEYAVEDADVTLQLKEILLPLLKEKNGLGVFHNIEVPLIPVLIAMEADGITLDPSVLHEYSKSLEKELVELTKVIYKTVGYAFNIDSPKQLGEALFDKLALDTKAKRTKKSRQYSTSEQTLSRLAAKHQVVRDILEYRSLRKLKNTYLDTLPETVFAKTGRVHTTYNQTVTATGRIQSQDPNLQNIPIKTEKGREIRKAFIARNDAFLLLAADYSQIELRIVAAMSSDESMIEAFREKIDIHKITAAKVYGVGLDDVTDEMRRRSKMVNFGIIYGISAFGLSQRLNIPLKEAKFIIEQYFIQYPKVKDYMDNTIEFARENGYVETIMGRRRYIRDINSANAVVRGAAERNAINAPIQGTAADMIKMAMITIHNSLNENSYTTRMLMQVHDELVFDLFREEREHVVPMIKEKMEHALKLDVPIVVDIGLGRNWLEAH